MHKEKDKHLLQTNDEEHVNQMMAKSYVSHLFSSSHKDIQFTSKEELGPQFDHETSI